MEVVKPPIRGSVRPSPVFFAVIGLCLFGLYSLMSGGPLPMRLSAFVFGTSIWILSLIFHEFGHAIMAWRGGDLSVAPKGYLTLNPFKYAHPITSIALPVGILLLGGIGLPGGAVFIDRSKLQPQDESLMSLAGPLANLGFAGLLLTPFLIGVVPTTLAESLNSASGLDLTAAVLSATLAFAAGIQIIAAVLNLLPIPPLDGFGIAYPWLPDSAKRAANRFGSLGFVLILFLLLSPGTADFIFAPVRWIFDLIGMDRDLLSLGFDCFRFWTNDSDSLCVVIEQFER